MSTPTIQLANDTNSTSIPVEQFGLYEEVVDFEKLYEKFSDKVILINKFNVANQEDRDKLNNLLYTEYEGDTLATVPSCECGALKDERNVGMICGNCGTAVISQTERPIESILWMKVPDAVHGFIHPNVYIILRSAFKKSNVDIFRWLIDPSYNPKSRISNDVQQLMIEFNRIGWKRSINCLIERFDEAVDTILSSINIGPQIQEAHLRTFISENKHKFFPTHLPIPNKMVFIVEKTPMNTYADLVMTQALDAVRTITSLQSSISPVTQQVRENRTVKIINELATYYSKYITDNMGKKPGMYRKQIFGGRLDYTARAVISSITKPHRYDEIYLPWSLATVLLKTHILNKLLKRGMNPVQAEEFLIIHSRKYSKLLDEIFHELIAEAPEKGLPCIFQRNPSLLRASAQHLYIVAVKTDINDVTISLSVLVLSGFNADFDGDEMNLKYLEDKRIADSFARLKPHLSVADTKAPFKISNMVELPKPVIATIANWMNRDA